MTNYLCLAISATAAALYGLARLVARRLEPEAARRLTRHLNRHLAAGDAVREDRDK